jgi:hypothetical protein
MSNQTAKLAKKQTINSQNQTCKKDSTDPECQEANLKNLARKSL